MFSASHKSPYYKGFLQKHPALILTRKISSNHIILTI